MKFSFSILLLLFTSQIMAQTKIAVTGNTDGNAAKVAIDYSPFYIDELNKHENLVLNGTAFNAEFITSIPQCIMVKADTAVYYLLVNRTEESDVKTRVGQQTISSHNEVNFYTKNNLLVGVGGGKNAIQQSFYNQFRQEFKEDYSELLKHAQSKTLDEFEDQLFKLKKAKLTWLDKAKQENPFAKDIGTFIRKEVNFAYYACILGYAANDCATKKTTYSKSLPSTIAEEIKQLEINDDGMLYSEWYKLFIVNYVAYFGSEKLNFKKQESYDELTREEFKIIDTQLKSATKQYALASLLLKTCDKVGAELNKQLLTKLKEIDKDGTVFKYVQSSCAEYLKAKPTEKKEDKPSVASKNYPFTLVNLEGKEFSIDQFKGKVVYIDFWASWCGPCRQQFPFSKKLHESMSKKQLEKMVFLYISIDDDEAAWKNAVKQYELMGVNGLSRGGWSSGVCSFFGISSIPRYMIIGKDGKILEDNAKRPSDESLKDDLLKLIE